MEYSLKDRTLLRLAILSSLLGLFFLFLISFLSPTPQKSIGELNESDLDTMVEVRGYVTDISYSKDNSTTFLRVKDSCYLDIVLFDHFTADDTYITVLGKYQEYDGKRSMVAERITQ